MIAVRWWYQIKPEDAVDIELPRPDIRGPLNELGKPCPWPWDPPQLLGAPIGQYHCPYCGAMVVAGLDHTDYRESEGAEGEAREESESGPGPEDSSVGGAASGRHAGHEQQDCAD